MFSEELLREHDACGVGFIADLSHTASHEIVRLALEAVGCMVHRGARASDGRTGDGAGILVETPRALLLREMPAMSRRVPERHLAAIALFLPRDPEEATGLRAQIEAAVYAADVKPMVWRRPKVDPEVLGEHARATRPLYEQLLVDMGPGNVRERMRQVRRNITRTLRDTTSAALVSASPDTVIYKGLLSSNELGSFFADLRDPGFTSRFAIFHQRFSTNTSPAWRLVQPFNMVAHNGEINTITGNRAWMHARGLSPIRGASDSLDFDTALDAMIGAGYRIDEAIDFMLAPAIDAEDDRLKSYYDAHVPSVEPWDGPAAMIFTDGDVVGAALDRNGFRPMRWARTASGRVLCASEAGVVDFGNDKIVERGRLGPGDRLVVRFASGELLTPQEFREERRRRGDFRGIVNSWAIELSRIADESASAPSDVPSWCALPTPATKSKTSSTSSRQAAANRFSRWATTLRFRSSNGACRSHTICASASRRSPTRRSIRIAKVWYSTCAPGSARGRPTATCRRLERSSGSRMRSSTSIPSTSFAPTRGLRNTRSRSSSAPSSSKNACAPSRAKRSKPCATARRWWSWTTAASRPRSPRFWLPVQSIRRLPLTVCACSPASPSPTGSGATRTRSLRSSRPARTSSARG